MIKIPRWFDRHLHIRNGEMLSKVLPHTLKQRAVGAVIMGNLPPGEETSSIDRTRSYQREIQANLPKDSDFRPVTTLYLTDRIKKEEVVVGFRTGVWHAAKLYLANNSGKGGTTGSHNGVRDLNGRYGVLEAMETIGMPLLVHGEVVDDETDEFDREIRFVENELVSIMRAFPRLKIVLEHITDRRVADFVAKAGDNIRATVTPHHLIINRNAMFRGGMNPEKYCRPVAKREEDRLKLIEHVTSGNRHFGAGTDSAPHYKTAKSRYCGCAAGIFTAPCAVELYASIFDEANKIEYLADFLSRNFLDWYGLKPSQDRMILQKEPWEVPEEVDGIRIFGGGTTLSWKLVD